MVLKIAERKDGRGSYATYIYDKLSINYNYLIYIIVHIPISFRYNIFSFQLYRVLGHDTLLT